MNRVKSLAISSGYGASSGRGEAMNRIDPIQAFSLRLGTKDSHHKSRTKIDRARLHQEHSEFLRL